MKSSTKKNLIFIAVVLLLAGLLFAAKRLIAPPAPENQLVAVLTYDGDKTMDIPLNEDAHFDLESGNYTIHLEVKDGSIRFIDSPCPDHVCEGYGWLSKEFDFAACLPAYASIVIQNTADAK